MAGMVREDKLTTYFGSTWSRATSRKADTSTERDCQSKMVTYTNVNEVENFTPFVTPPFCQWIRPKSINHN